MVAVTITGSTFLTRLSMLLRRPSMRAGHLSLLHLRTRQFLGLHFELAAQLGQFAAHGLELTLQFELATLRGLHAVHAQRQVVDAVAQVAVECLEAAAQINDGLAGFFVVKQAGKLAGALAPAKPSDERCGQQGNTQF